MPANIYYADKLVQLFFMGKGQVYPGEIRFAVVNEFHRAGRSEEKMLGFIY